MELIVSGLVISRAEKKSGITKDNKSWSAIDYVLEEQGQYPKKVCFTIFGDEKVQNAMVNLHQRDYVTVHCNVDASEYQGRYYNKITAWKIIKGDVDILTGNTIASNAPSVAQSQPQPQPTQQSDPTPPVDDNMFGGTGEEVPF